MAFINAYSIDKTLLREINYMESQDNKDDTKTQGPKKLDNKTNTHSLTSI